MLKFNLNEWPPFCGMDSCLRSWQVLLSGCLVGALFVTMSCDSKSVGQDPARHEATHDEIRQWLKALDSDSYAEREAANRKLSRHLEAAFPQIVETATNTGGDTAIQLIQLIGLVAQDAMTPNGKLAYDSLVELSRPRITLKAMAASSVLESVGIHMRGLAFETLTGLGARIGDESQIPVLTRPKTIRNMLTIDDRFTGNEEHLQWIKWLGDIEFVRLQGSRIRKSYLEAIVQLPRINGIQIVDTNLSASDLTPLRAVRDLEVLEILYTPIGDEAIPILVDVPVFRDMQLFGTQLTPAGTKQLKDRMENTEVFVGKGGHLGVVCDEKSLVVSNVTDDGAAKPAGIQAGDRLTKINDVPIQVFDELRRELAKYSAGDTVVVEYERRLVAFGFSELDRGIESQENEKPSSPTSVTIKVEVQLRRRPDRLR